VNQEQFIIRTQSDFANTYSVGEKVADRVYLFRANETNLTLVEAKALLVRKTQVKKAH
jgi:hypothetical protein